MALATAARCAPLPSGRPPPTASPCQSEHLRMLATDRAGALLAATLDGRRRPLTGVPLLPASLLLPRVALKIIAAIHWHALRLWIKGAKIVERPRLANESAGSRPE